MAIPTVLSRAQHGMEAPLVRVEVHLGSGLPHFAIVGLPEAVVQREQGSRARGDRQLRLRMPDGRITVNLSPADLPQGRRRFDLPIAIGILIASDQVPCELLVGRASCTASCRSAVSCSPMRGALLAAAARGARRASHRSCRRRTSPRRSLVSGCAGSRCREASARRRAHTHGLDQPDFATTARRRCGRAPVHLDLRRRARSDARKACARDRGGRRTQRPADRSARHGQEHACAAPAGPAAADERGGSARGRGDPQRRGLTLKHRASGVRGRFRSSASHAVGDRARGRRDRCHGPARSRSRITACCSSTSCRSSIAACSKLLREPLESGLHRDLARGTPGGVSGGVPVRSRR